VIADPAAYDRWYETPRGRWIGDTEYRLLRRLLEARPGETLLDAGCGTGYFGRRFAADGHAVTGIDADAAAVAFARGRAAGPAHWLAADMAALPFADRSFDCVVAVTSLCFVAEERRAIREMLRVARRRVALGLLNRHSLLWWQKGRGGGSGAYAGAHWHRADEAAALFDDLPATGLQTASAIALPGGGALARRIESHWPESLHCGGFLALAVSVGAGDGR
jgi:SAM-dependent methyltransferase